MIDEEGTAEKTRTLLSSNGIFVLDKWGEKVLFVLINFQSEKFVVNIGPKYSSLKSLVCSLAPTDVQTPTLDTPMLKSKQDWA